ncbi:MAG: M56 family metallopeptidase [Pseudomonadota bacterium]
MMDWFVDTLIWTGILIGLVLMIRRPVGRWFGPQMAYALWALPMARLFLPPIELPASFAPQDLSQNSMAALDQNAAMVVLDSGTRSSAPVATTFGSAGSGAAVPDQSGLITPIASLDSAVLVSLALAVWLIGAAAFLYMRFSAYFRLRAELLEDAREVGRDGDIRLIETPGTDGPLAFGVINKVIALPLGFMAQPDRKARDLALSHELAHHKGRDLAINMAVQPLFAMHWFNPLGRYGWLALRRDQEAACDARVIAAEPKETRAHYANVIASFAAGPNIALAAPMACPVLGDKSIVHRLRSLTMSDTSKTRRIAGRAMLGAAALALPLTASISYAESQAEPPAPPAPVAPAIDAPVPPAPPAPPVSPAPDVAPLPPAPPATASSVTILKVDPDTGETREIDVDTEEDVTVVVKSDKNSKTTSRYKKVSITNNGQKLSEEERQEILAEVRESLAEADHELKRVPQQIEMAMAELREAEGGIGRTVIKMECSSSSDDVATTTTDQNGVTTTMICQSRVMAHALEGLKEARKAILRSPDLDKSMRKDIVKELDRQIKDWEKSIS